MLRRPFVHETIQSELCQSPMRPRTLVSPQDTPQGPQLSRDSRLLLQQGKGAVDGLLLCGDSEVPFDKIDLPLISGQHPSQDSQTQPGLDHSGLEL